MRHAALLALYRAVVDPAHTFELIAADQLVARGLATTARSNCILASSRLADLGLAMRPLAVALPDVMARYRLAVADLADCHVS